MTDLEVFKLNDNPKLSTLHWDKEENWLELRKKGIGGSDIGAIMGLSPYKSPLQVYKEKVEGIKQDLSKNVAVQKGKALEGLIFNSYVRPMLEKDGYLAGKPEFMIINSEYPFFRANLDGIAFNSTGDKQVIEIKVVTDFAEVLWNKPEYHGVPAYYYAQVQEYMLVTGIRKAKICALFERSWTMHYFDIEWDDVFMAKMILAGKQFFDLNMTMRVPPMARVDLDKDAVVKAAEESKEPANPSKEMTELVKKYVDMDSKVKKANKYLDDLKSKILDLYTKGFKPDDETHKVKITSVTTNRFDSTRFKKDQPGLYEQYSKESKSTKFTIK